MNKAKYICDSINQIYGVNIYENKRTQDLVDIRSMACYILHKDLKLTLHKTKDYFNSRGKKMTHCTVLHNLKVFEQARKIKPELEAVRDSLMTKFDPKYLLLKRIQNIEDKEQIERIINCINYNEHS